MNTIEALKIVGGLSKPSKMPGWAYGIPAAGATKIKGLIGYAVNFDNSANARIELGSGGGTGPGTGSFAVSDGVTIEALIRPEYSGDFGDIDEIFRKDRGDKALRMLLSFQHDQGKNYLKPEGDVKESLSFGLFILGQGYHELKLPLDGKNGRPTLAALKDGNYHPKPSKATISNAMDVGNPSNFIRIQELFDNDLEKLKQQFSSYSFTDDETRMAMKSIKEISGYVADPHGAVGYLGLKNYQSTDNEYGIFLETAHPVKFLDVVQETLDTKVDIPMQIQAILHKEKVAKQIATYEELKEFLNS